MLRVLAGLAVLYALVRVARAEAASELPGEHGLSPLPDWTDPRTALTWLENSLMPYYLPETARPYLAALHDAEIRNGIPAGLLVRIAYQESRFRPEIIGCQKNSSAGAKGIMQIVPRWHPGVNPCDPAAAIPYAGRFLRQMYDQFHDWKLALMAYNWGSGNVSKYLKGQASPPFETQQYVAQITSDVPVA